MAPCRYSYLKQLDRNYQAWELLELWMNPSIIIDVLTPPLGFPGNSWEKNIIIAP